jgi:dienelactone hydrolase
MELRIGGLISVFFALALLPSAAQTAGKQAPAALPVGQVIDSVACADDPTETYALYLPSTYTPAKPWPIIYAFDPGAWGKVPVKLYKDAAEKYGYIVAGSNNSQNFAMAETSKAANAVWRDTHVRFSLDEHQSYTTGFSGGARVAGLVALRCPQCKIAGVIANGAGYPNTERPPQKDSFLYFFSIGNQDFNWPEVMNVRREREDSGAAYRVREFPGPHQWAPPAVIEDAVEWIHLKAMQAGAQPPDAAFIERFYGRMRAEALDAETRGDTIAQLNAYRSLVSDFAGFKDVKEYETKLAALKKSPAWKTALKKEQDAMTNQNVLTGEISSKLAGLADAGTDARSTLEADIAGAMTRLKAQGGRSKSEEMRLVMLRSFNDLYAQGVEAGQAEMERKHFDRAEVYFRLMSEIAPEDPWPPLLLAETRAAMGDKKIAIKELREAIKRGVKNPDVFEKDGNLRSLRSDREFQTIIEELRAKYVPQ